MGFSFTPKEVTCFTYIQEHGEKNSEAATILYHVMTGKLEAQAALAQVNTLADEAHQLVLATTGRLEKTFITSMDREDIQHIMDGFDVWMETVRRTTEAYCIYALEDSHDGVVNMIHLLLEAAKTIETTSAYIHDLRNHTDDLAAQGKRIQAISHDSVTTYHEEMNRLCSVDERAGHILKWQEVLQGIVQTIDAACEIVSTFRKVALKYA